MPEYFEGFIVHSYFFRGKDSPRLYLIGRLKNGKTFAVVEERQRPGFYLRESELSAAIDYLRRSGDRWEESAAHTIDDERCVWVNCDSVQQCQQAVQSFTERGIRTYEGDIRFADQFLMSRGIHGSVTIQGSPRKGRRVDLIFINPEISPSDWEPCLSVLSMDIETDPRGNEIYAISLVFRDPWSAEERQEVLFSGSIEGNNTITAFPDERFLLEGFCERILQWDPDIITGWNVIDFDFKIIAKRIKHRQLPFQIGRADTPASFLLGEKRRSHTVIIPGRQVLDAVRLVRAAPEHFSDYTLETVSLAVLGRGKELDLKENESRTEAVVRMYRENPISLCRYCLEDSRLVLDILDRTGLMDLTLRRCLLIGISLDRAWTSIPAFEYLYIEALHRCGGVAPTLGVDLPPVVDTPGGAILEPQTGLYDNVWVFDFKSLYPSIIRTFNIDPVSYVPQETMSQMPKEEQNRLIGAPNGTCFKRQAAILPELLERFFESRDAAKRRGDEVASYVYKIIMNTFYGVLCAQGSRFASGHIAGAITSFGRHLLHWSKDYFTRISYPVLYGDTDSLFVLSGLPQDTPKEELLEKGRQICDQINTELNQYISETFEVRPYLELEFEKTYHRFFLPPVRGATDSEKKEIRGRAKGYAGLLVPVSELKLSIRPEERSRCIEVVGMEAVRRDWTDLAKGFQIGLLTLLFHGAAISAFREFIHKVVTDLYDGKLDEKLVYTKALRKPISEYTHAKPPHVRAAGMLDPEEQRGLIHYLWTHDGPQPAGRLSSTIDYDHYVEKQLKPIAQSFTEVLGTDLKRLFGEEEQLRLF